jgi:hypothetical protein
LTCFDLIAPPAQSAPPRHPPGVVLAARRSAIGDVCKTQRPQQLASSAPAIITMPGDAPSTGLLLVARSRRKMIRDQARFGNPGLARHETAIQNFFAAIFMVARSPRMFYAAIPAHQPLDHAH